MPQARIMPFSLWFVAIVYIGLAASFIISTAMIVSEFRDHELMFILSSNSQLFIFFPTLGIVALAAFYLPSVIFADLYLSQRVKHGRLRFAIGFVVVVALSLWFVDNLNSTTMRTVWEVSPQALTADAERQPACQVDKNGTRLCREVRPILPVVAELRTNAVQRLQLTPFVRECSADKLVEAPPENAVRRYCFAAREHLDACDCFKVSKAFQGRVLSLYRDDRTRSEAAKLDQLLFLPLKAFFIIVIILIGLLLIFWKKTLRLYYKDYLPAMERGLQIGALAMLPWPIMDYGYQLTADVLYGPAGVFPLRFSLVLLPWALLLAGYFADRIAMELPRLVQIVGGLISAIAILRFRDVSDWSAKLLGIGASELNFYVLALASAAAVIYLFLWLPGALRGEDKGDEEELPAHHAGSGDGPLT